MSDESEEARLVVVCNRCLRAQCWRGELYCDEAKTAGTAELPVATLRELKLEHPSHWKDDGRD